MMRFEKAQTIAVEILIKPRSLMIMKDEARYNWTHMIPTRFSGPRIDGHKSNGSNYYQGCRTSITIRKIRKDFKCECSYKTLCDYQNTSLFHHQPDHL